MTERIAAPALPTTPYVFICYAHDEREIVVEQIDWLKGQGFTVWFDEAIEAGSRWSDDLARAVEGCSAFLYFLSPRSVSSRYSLDEVHFALECGRPIVPVEIAPVTLTPGLKLSRRHPPALHAQDGIGRVPPQAHQGAQGRFRTFDKISYGLIVHAERTVSPGDHARTP